MTEILMPIRASTDERPSRATPPQSSFFVPIAGQGGGIGVLRTLMQLHVCRATTAHYGWRLSPDFGDPTDFLASSNSKVPRRAGKRTCNKCTCGSYCQTRETRRKPTARNVGNRVAARTGVFGNQHRTRETFGRWVSTRLPVCNAWRVNGQGGGRRYHERV